MKSRITANIPRNKVIAVWLLFTTAGLITLLGLGFCVYCLLGNVQLTVMQSSIPGALFGAIIAFLGVRYILSVRKLRTQVYGTQSQFSLNNFKTHS